MKEHINFYENVAEAEIRINNTVVLYDGDPHYVLCVTDHMKDGIIRVYLDDMANPEGMAMSRIPGIPNNWHDDGQWTRGAKMDKFIEDNPTCGIKRKHMSSPKFNKFRPFPLGMCNANGDAVYVERSPTRLTQQGLIGHMLHQRALSVGDTLAGRRFVDVTGQPIVACVKGDYPTAAECIENLNNPRCTNSGAGFNRKFAFVRGPCGVLFLAYKSDIVGLLPQSDFSSVVLSKEFEYTREAVEELDLFCDVKVRSI